REGCVQGPQIVRKHLRPHLSKCFGWRLRAIPVNATISDIIFEAMALPVKAPGPKLGTIKGQLKPVVAVLKCCQVVSPFGEQRCQQKRAHRQSQQCHLRGVQAVDKQHAWITQTADTERDRPDNSDGENEYCSGGEHGATTSRHPKQKG